MEYRELGHTGYSVSVIASIQIIFNMFRLKPAEEVFPLAQDRRVGIIARVPLASGLLSGKMTRERHFAPDDHRMANRHGEQRRRCR